VAVNINLSDTIRSMAAKGVKFYDSPTGGDEVPPEQAIEGIGVRQLSPPSSPPNESSGTATDGDRGD
jgi:hypothetical protein